RGPRVRLRMPHPAAASPRLPRTRSRRRAVGRRADRVGSSRQPYRPRGHRSRRTGILTASGASRRGGEHDDVQFEVKADSGGNYSWWLSSSNGQTVAWAGESFASKSNATRAAESFKAGAAEARYELYEDKGGNWRWRAHRGNNVVAVPG